MSEIKGCMNCGNISCKNNKKRESKGCGRYISPEDKIKELEKENAELKEKLNPENCLKLLAKEGYIKFTSEQLNKAKEIIKNLLSAYTTYADSFDDRDNEIVEEAEQFLKESEVEK